MQDTLEDLRKRLLKFNEERDWSQFHSPKNLAMALTGEIGELSEIFQWLSCEHSNDIMKDSKASAAVKEEIADIFLYTITLAEKCGIDLIKEANNKINKNAEKYPVSKAKGNAKKYSEL